MIAPQWPAGSSRLRSVLSVCAWAALALFLIAGPLRSPGAFVAAAAIDFEAVYCGVEVAGHGADPYRVEPLRSCEHRVAPVANPADAWTVVPAPLPSYTLALLRPLAELPFAAAKIVWIGLAIGSLIVAAGCAARVTGLPFAGVLLAFTPALGLVNIYYGEPIPLAIAAIGLAALAVQTGHQRWGGVFATLALIEPHIGLGAAAGAFVALPRTRRSIVITGLVLAVAGLVTLGPARNLEYFRLVLPGQARAEVAVNYQLSLTHALVMAGAAVRPALVLGSLSYALMLGLGVAAGRSFARTAAAGAVYVPVAFTMLGGSYIHTPEIAAALPGALFIACRAAGRSRLVAAIGAALLILGWNAGSGRITDVPLGLAAVFITVALLRERGRAPLATALTVALALGVFVALIPPGRRVSHPRPAQPALIRPDDLSSADWEMLVSSRGWMLDEDVRRFMLKAPQWLGLALTIGAAGGVLRARPIAAGATAPSGAGP